MLHWYALNSKPHRERFLQDVLADAGIESYLPLWRPRGHASELRPYFPSYLFARADLNVIALSKVQFLPGLRSIVSRGGEPVVVQPVVIDGIQKHLADLDLSVLDRLGHKLTSGDRVVITGGVLEGYEAVFDHRLSSGERVRVLIDFLQQRSPCEIDARWVQKKVLRGFAQDLLPGRTA
jgi:transcriptional antiterminator RfaH